MHELVIVLSDFYVSQETPDRELPAGVTLPGMQQAARFGSRERLPDGWRGWLSRWLNGGESGAPATVAAASLLRAPRSTIATTAHAWLATPMHLIAGLTSIHVDRRSILRLDAADQAALAADFQRVFHDSGFHLRPLDAGDFLMLGPQMPVAATLEPARFMGASMADARRGEAANSALLRLGAEIEMWLYDHPVNEGRRRRGEPPVTALWLWGGGDVATHRERTSATPHLPDIAFGRDSYLQGLWAGRGAKVAPLPEQLTDVFGYPQAQRAVLLIEIGVMLQSNSTWTIFDALAQIDRSFIVPAIEALKQGRCERLVIIANDNKLTLRARDRLKIWRRTPRGLSGLQ